VLVFSQIVALVIVSALLWRTVIHEHYGVGLALILGGALGNLWDRLVSGRVVDFLLFYVGLVMAAFTWRTGAHRNRPGLLVF